MPYIDIENPLHLKDSDVKPTIALNNNDIMELASGIQQLAAVTSPHTMAQGNSGHIVKFNSSSTGVLNIPDGLTEGSSVIVLNLGTGAASFNMTGSETMRGAVLLGNASGMMSATKITSTIWQSSER